MEINVKTNVRDAIKRLDRVQRRQVPFAASKALNDTAEFTATNLNNDTRKYLDRPTPFTQKAFSIKRSSKRNLRAKVFAKERQAEYLQWQIFGGTQFSKGQAHVLPVNIKRNRYGNMPKGRIQKLLARPDTFSGVLNGVPGIWQRTRTGTKLMAAYEKRAAYQPVFPYRKLVRRYVDRAINPFFDRALARALRTAR